MRKLILASFTILALGMWASAQTKISGTQTCAKPDPLYTVQVGDTAKHVLSMSQTKCTWPKPIEMEGVQTKDDVGTTVSDVRGTNSRDHGYDVSNMSNGDKLFVRFQSTTKVKDGVPEVEGKWNFTGGTGKFKNLKGGGTFKGKGNADGSSTADIEGEYTIGK